MIANAKPVRYGRSLLSRVMGYYRPVTFDGGETHEWNPGKTSEFYERKYFKEEIAMNSFDGQISEDFVQKLHKLKKVS